MATLDYASIRSAALEYRSIHLSYQNQLTNFEGIDFDKLPLIIFMGKSNLERLLETSGCNEIAAVMNTNGDHFSIAFLCVDSNGAVLNSHVNGTLDGEEVWPSTISISDQTKINNFLVAPQ